MEQKIILKTENLSVGYISKKMRNTIASDINLTLQKGSLIALIGANGIGKSTLLRSITGIQKPLSGKISLNDKNIFNYSALELAQNLSLVLTEKLPPSNLTVFELVALGRQPYTNWIGTLTDNDVSNINRALELTQITSLAAKKHYEISDGQLQKVMIARALAQDTPIIILDEPTTHLDLLHKVSLFKLLKNLSHETNKCILFSTHDIDLAIEMSDEMILMSAKKTIQDSPLDMISNNAFDELFQDDSISFDREKVKFVFKNSGDNL